MRPISIEGFEKPKSVSAGAAPMLQWLKITDLVVDPAYQRPIIGKGRQNVDRIARAFSWSCFAPVVVSPVAGGKFAIIDGQHRTTAATLVGFDSVPCQIVIAAKEEQAAAFKAINGTTTPISIMALHAAALVACEPWAVQIAHVCACAQVELALPGTYGQAGPRTNHGGRRHRPVPQAVRRGDADHGPSMRDADIQQPVRRPVGAHRQSSVRRAARRPRAPGQRPCAVRSLRFHRAISDASVLDAAVKKVGRVQVMADRIREELGRALPQKTVIKKAGQGISGDERNVVEFPVGHSAPAKDVVPLRKA
jgi:hypothetical protein